MSGRHDVERDRGRDVLVELDRDLVGAERLDRVGHHDHAAVDLLTARVREGVGDLGGGDGAEEATTLTGTDLDVDLARLELGLDLLGVVLVARGARGPAACARATR